MLSKFFIARPIFATVVSVVIIVAGVTSLLGLPVAAYPDLAPPTISVTAVYPGADAETVASTVASPIEQEVNGVEGMLYMQSTSAGNGSYTLNVTFETGTDLDIASVQVQNRVASAEPSLPAEVRQLGLTTQKKMPDFAQMLSVTSPDGRFDDVFLSNFATLQLRDQLKRVPGVGDVMVFGAAEYAMRVWIDPEKLEVRGLTVSDVLGAIREQNVQVAAGTIGQPPAPAGTAFQYAVTARGRLLEASEFERIIIRSTDDGRVLRLGDVARVELGAQNYSMESRVDGGPAAVLAVFQLPGANLIEISDAIQALIDDLRPSFPEGVDVSVTFDAASEVRTSIREIVTTLFIAAVLVILTVLVFLQDIRATIIPAVTIPVSLIGTFAVMALLGFSLNTLTLFGLVLAIGIVVDDAIVVVENVGRNLEGGRMSPKEAAEVAMREVTGPIVATTLVLLAVFVPTSFMGGLTGVMYNQFGLTIAAATVFSSINALTLSPALCGVLLRPSSGQKNAVFRWFDRFIGRSTEAYTRAVTLGVRKAAIAGIGFVVVCVVGAFSFLSLPGGFVPDEDKGYLMAAVQLPDAASRERTRAVTDEINGLLEATDGIRSSIQIGGYSLIDGVANPNVASYIIVLDSWDERTDPALVQQRLQMSLQRRLQTIQEAVAFAFSPPPLPGVGFAGGFDMQVQDRGGAGVDALQASAVGLVQAAQTQSGVTGLNTSFRATVPQLFVDVDREKVKQLGLSVGDVFGALQTNLGGTYANDFNTFNRTFQVQVQADASARAHPEDILKLKLRDGQGRSVPMISRYNLYPTASVKGQAAEGFSSGQAIGLMEQVAERALPPSMGFEWTGLALQEKEAAGGIVLIFGLALLLVFLVLAAQYESWLLPVTVLLAVPLGLLGVAAGVLARGLDNNVYTQIGVILLIALVSKNAILIVEFARAKRMEGESPADAALNAAELRFRPILMTAFSFVLGTLRCWSQPVRVPGHALRSAPPCSPGSCSRRCIGVFFTPVLYRVAAVAFAIVRTLFGRQSHVTSDTLCQAVSVFLLLGLVWAMAYALLEMVAPGSFAFAGVDAEGGVPYERFVGFSFTTLTTLGYGNIAPATARADAVANAEALVGQIYIAVVIARLVAIQLAESREGTSERGA
jgi:HAE1 family hydrophobic/amphiphilic exporter-1